MILIEAIFLEKGVSLLERYKTVNVLYRSMQWLSHKKRSASIEVLLFAYINGELCLRAGTQSLD